MLTAGNRKIKKKKQSPVTITAAQTSGGLRPPHPLPMWGLCPHTTYVGAPPPPIMIGTTREGFDDFLEPRTSFSDFFLSFRGPFGLRTPLADFCFFLSEFFKGGNPPA